MMWHFRKTHIKTPNENGLTHQLNWYDVYNGLFLLELELGMFRWIIEFLVETKTTPSVPK
jgi:hypothetical protein